MIKPKPKPKSNLQNKNRDTLSPKASSSKPTSEFNTINQTSAEEIFVSCYCASTAHECSILRSNLQHVNQGSASSSVVCQCPVCAYSIERFSAEIIDLQAHNSTEEAIRAHTTSTRVYLDSFDSVFYQKWWVLIGLTMDKHGLAIPLSEKGSCRTTQNDVSTNSR